MFCFHGASPSSLFDMNARHANKCVREFGLQKMPADGIGCQLSQAENSALPRFVGSLMASKTLVREEATPFPDRCLRPFRVDRVDFRTSQHVESSQRS
jgi:hypothetical protein